VALKVERVEDMKSAMEAALAMRDRLVFLDIYVDPQEHVYPMLVPKASMRDMWLSKTEKV